MAVSSGYLSKLRVAVRIRTATATLDIELTDYIEECRRDLESLGVLTSKTTDETDSLILGAVRSFARWKYSQTTEDAEGNRRDYMDQRDELRRKREYIGYTIAFTITASGSPLPDATVTFNGESKDTGALGTAIFYGVDAGTNQEYIIEADGYATVTVNYDVTATATVAVAMTGA